METSGLRVPSAAYIPSRADDRRFTDKPDLDPASVRSLPNGHPALVENRTLFPSTVVDVDEYFNERLLVSGKSNRKLGERILKGKFKGYALYGLSLEERATCPASCIVRGFCYGNGMQMARRHRITDLDLFATFLEAEIGAILADPIDGLMVRLHVLGDFPSVEYVAMWADLLEEHDRLSCYGYTHRLVSGIGGDEIGDAIFSLKGRFPDRFRIRWSSDKKMPDAARIIDRTPEGKRVPEGLVCPAQTDATACCASCGLCWELSAKNETICFVKHGPKSDEVSAEAARTQMVAAANAPTRDTFGADILACTPSLKAYAISLCRSPDRAEDLVQETFVRAIANRAQFEEGSNLAAWLMTILKNHYLSSLRKEKRMVEDPDDAMAGALTAPDNQDDAMEYGETMERIDGLPSSQRDALMEVAGGASYDSAAQKFGVPVGTIKSRVNRARSAIEHDAEDHAEMAVVPSEGIRPVISIPIPQKKDAILSRLPDVRRVNPNILRVEPAYQRDLSGKSIRLIRKIVIGWDWAKFKPPVCAETADGLFIIDGQHTAIAAASHPDITEIPVMVVEADRIERRAEAFVAHNRDRLTMTPAQIFYGDVAAGNKDAKAALDAITRAGATIPRLQVQKGYSKPGQIAAVGEVRSIGHAHGADMLERIARIAVLAKASPITKTVLGALRALLTDSRHKDVAEMHDARIAAAVSSIKNIEAVSAHYAAETGQGRTRACAALVAASLTKAEAA